MSEQTHQPEENIENPDKIVKVLREDYTETAPSVTEEMMAEPMVGREGYRSLPRWVHQVIMGVSIIALLFVASVLVLDASLIANGGQTAVANDLNTPYPTPVDEIFTAPEPTEWATPAPPEPDTIPAEEWQNVPEPTNLPDPPTPTPLPEP